MTGIYPPPDHATLFVPINDDTEAILSSYMNQEGVDIYEAVRCLIELGEMGWDIRRGTAPNTSGHDSAGNAEAAPTL